jgi:hypothetical protein
MLLAMRGSPALSPVPADDRMDDTARDCEIRQDNRYLWLELP